MTSVSSSKGSRPVTPSKVKITTEKNSWFHFPLVGVLILIVIAIFIIAIAYGVNYNKRLDRMDKEKEEKEKADSQTVTIGFSDGNIPTFYC